MEQNERLRNAFGHGGMVSAAENIFRDLDENGILRTLIHGADYNSQRWAHLHCNRQRWAQLYSAACSEAT